MNVYTDTFAVRLLPWRVMSMGQDSRLTRRDMTTHCFVGGACLQLMPITADHLGGLDHRGSTSSRLTPASQPDLHDVGCQT